MYLRVNVLEGGSSMSFVYLFGINRFIMRFEGSFKTGLHLIDKEIVSFYLIIVDYKYQTIYIMPRQNVCDPSVCDNNKYFCFHFIYHDILAICLKNILNHFKHNIFIKKEISFL